VEEKDQVRALADLMEVLADWLRSGRGTIRDAVLVWLGVETGAISPEDPCPVAIPASQYIPPIARRDLALQVARRDGRVSTLQMADACGVTQEAIRRDFARLAEEGLLVAEGTKSGRIWRAAGGG
jgi:CRP-like cAMP-binding protein